MANGKKNTEVKGNTGVRYTEDTKKEVASFVEKAGRGGVKQAMKDYGVSYIAIRSWLKKYGKNAPKTSQNKVGRPKKSSEGNKRGRKANPNTGVIRMFLKMKKNLDKLNIQAKQIGKVLQK